MEENEGPWCRWEGEGIPRDCPAKICCWVCSCSFSASVTALVARYNFLGSAMDTAGWLAGPCAPIRLWKPWGFTNLQKFLTASWFLPLPCVLAEPCPHRLILSSSVVIQKGNTPSVYHLMLVLLRGNKDVTGFSIFNSTSLTLAHLYNKRFGGGLDTLTPHLTTLTKLF